MPINAIHFGNLSALNPVQLQRQGAVNGVAQNFQANHTKGELTPKVQNEVLANKLDLFA